jgi:hypothetical protein
MSKKDKLKEEIGILRDDYKNYFIIFMAIVTASFASFYQVILKNVPIWVLLIAAVGLISSIVVIGLMKKKRFEIDDKLDLLEELE